MTDTTQITAALADRYTIERELGAGGMATVYLAHDVKHDRKVALKVLRPELAAVIGAERFLAEIKTTANLQHPHILPLHDSGQVAGTVFYVMPFVEGESLRDRLVREKQLPVDVAVRIATEVASALDYAHRHGVIHRDIKPENILLHDGQALIADFGIALAASNTANTRMTETGMSLGTPHYMSPEQAMGERTLDARSDVYSLGAVVYEMLTGDPPHTGSTVQAIVAKVLSEAPTSITRTRSMVPPNVDAAVQRALAKTPADRFNSAAEFAAALANPSYALPTSVQAAAAAARRSAWNPVSIGATALAVVLLATTLTGWLRQGPAADTRVNRQRIVLPSAPPTIGDIGIGSALAADGSSIVFPDSTGGTVRLWIKQRGERTATPISGTEGAFSAAISPDGKWLAYITGTRVKKVALVGGTPSVIADSASSNIPAVTWLDDSTIVFVTANLALQRVSASGGRSERLYSVNDTLRRSLVSATALPGGRAVLMTGCAAGCVQAGVWSLDIGTHRTKLIDPDGMKAWYLPGGYIAIVHRDGAVFAAKFDLKTDSLASTPVPVFDGVRVVGGIADMVVSPLGNVLYASGAGTQGEIESVWVARDGTVAVVDTTWRFQTGPNEGRALSPDGTRFAINIAGTDGSDIWVKQLDKGPLTRLTTFGGRTFRPTWTPDGRYVLFMSDHKDASYDLYRVRADGSSAPEVILNLAKSITEAFMSPDGKWIVMRTGGLGGQSGGRDIVAFRPGTDTVPTTIIAQDKFDSKVPALSPDGKWLAYESTESGKEEIYVRPFPNAADGKFTISAHGGFSPLWSHSGREIYYLNAAGDLIAATVKTVGGFSVVEEKKLFSATPFARPGNSHNFDVSPDDRRFMFLRGVTLNNAPGSVTDLVLIENWLTEVKAKVGK